MMLLSLIWSTKIAPNSEQNKTFAMCAVMGDWWLEKLVTWHPSIPKNMADYWCGFPWRNQPEIYDAIVEYVHRRLKK